MTTRHRSSTWRLLFLVARRALHRFEWRSHARREMSLPPTSPPTSGGAAEVPVLQEQIAVDQNEKELLFLVLGSLVVLLAVGSGVMSATTRSTNLGGGKLLRPEKPVVVAVDDQGEIHREDMPAASVADLEELKGRSVVLRWCGQPSQAVDRYADAIDRLSRVGVKVHVCKSITRKENSHVEK